jgi:hypothetical protein
MKYDAQKGDQQWSDLSTMNELDMDMTVPDTIPVGLQAFLYFFRRRDAGETTIVGTYICCE